MKKLIFVCSPFRGDIENNILYAKRCCALVLSEGNVPFAPHLFFPQFLDDTIPAARQIGIESGLEIMGRCDEVHVFGEVITDGIAYEIIEAEKLGKPVIYHVKGKN